MGDMDWGRLVYLGILGAVLISWLFAQNRDSLTKKAQQALAWVFIFIAAIAVVGLWEDVRSTVAPGLMQSSDGRVELPRAPDGHYYMTLLINDVSIRFLVDTGATDIVLTEKDAARVGLNLANLAYLGRAMTANGEVRTAHVVLDEIVAAGHKDRNVSAWVNGGDLEQSLLGMAYLNRWNRIEITGRSLVLTR